MNKFLSLLTDKNLDSVIIINPSNIKYSTGFLADFCYVLLTNKGNYYFTDGRFLIEAKRELSNDWQVVEINSINAMESIFQILSSNNIKTIGMDLDINYIVYKEFMTILKGLEIFDLTQDMLMIRSIKDSFEIDCIKKAQAIAEKSLKQLLHKIENGVTEREIAGVLDYLMIKNGSSGASFKTIVAFGENSAIAHAKPSDRVLKDGDIILIDFGATFNGYCSDMTRTYVNKFASEITQNMYDAVLRANERVIEDITAGISAKQVDEMARLELSKSGYEQYFNHSLGHGLGVDIHEFPSLNSRGADIVLKPNMVVTIEPGVYIEGIGGVRIEDMIVVTERGCVNLTTSNKKLKILNR